MNKIFVGLLVSGALFMQVCGIGIGISLFATAVTGIYYVVALLTTFIVPSSTVWCVAFIIGIAYSRGKYSMVWEPVDKNEKPPESN